MTHFDNNAKNLAEIIDHLITVPVFSGATLANRPVVLELYAAARAKSSGPLVLDAAEKIVSAASALEGKEKKSVILATGFVVPPWIQPGTDGPVGTVSLARSLALALDLTPVIITEPGSVGKQEKLAEQGGFNITSYEKAIKVPRSLEVEGIYAGSFSGQRRSRKAVGEDLALRDYLCRESFS